MAALQSAGVSRVTQAEGELLRAFISLSSLRIPEDGVFARYVRAGHRRRERHTQRIPYLLAGLYSQR